MRKPVYQVVTQAELCKLLKSLSHVSGGKSANTSGIEDGRTREIILTAVSEGLVLTSGGRLRLSSAGQSFLRRRLAEGDGFQEQHQERTHRDVETGGGRRERLLVNDSESPLQWLRRRHGKDGKPMLDEAQFKAGERLRTDFEFGAMAPRVGASWGLSGASGAARGPSSDPAGIRDDVLAARERVRRALAAVGPELAHVLVEVCCHLRGLSDVEGKAGWPQRSGKLVLTLALTALARHFGLIGRETPRKSGPMLHWGGDGYRPGLK